MPIVPTTEILRRAFADRYGVAAINVVNDLTMEAVLAAAVEVQAPVIIQTSVKTVRSIGMRVLYTMFREMASDLAVPVALHLDHCPDRALISACLEQGWNSVLFDGSRLGVAENRDTCMEIVAQAHALGAAVEGEIEPIQGVEDGIGSDEASERRSLDVALDFIRQTGVDCFAPAIGNAHGMYAQAPELDADRVSAIVAAEPIPIALHGGSGLPAEAFSDLIARGCAKVNISTALKVRYMQASLTFLSENRGTFDPPSLFSFVRGEVIEMARDHMRLFGSEGPGLVRAIVFDCDGVLADTERYGHLPAFNQTFEELGLPIRWSPQEYGRLLSIGGGKERMASVLTDELIATSGLPRDPEQLAALVGAWHARKTAIYAEMVDAHRLVPRAGIRRIIHDAIDATWRLAVASTSAERSVHAILDMVAGSSASRFDFVLAGDVVPRKKPAADIYLLAIERLGLGPSDIIVIEDSRNGLMAAHAAGLACVVTVNDYTRSEVFSEACLVVDSLGDPDGEVTRVIEDRAGVTPGAWVTLGDLARCLPSS